MIPETETALAEAIRETKTPLAVRGGGTRQIGPAVGELLSVKAMSGISTYEPGALTLVAAAGTPIEEIDAALAVDHQQLSFEPMDARKLLGSKGLPTIGGAVAANISGPRRIQAGACRDSVLGVRFVDGTGAVVKNGGRVMKNVTGYDLVKLMAGSYGTLGVLTEVAIKVLPATASRASIEIAGLSDHDAVRAMAKAVGSPFDLTGAAHLPHGANGVPTTVLRIEGLDASVSYRAEKLVELAQGFGDTTLERDPEKVADTWRAIRDVEPFSEILGDVWRLSVRPSQAPDIAARAAGQVIYDWAGGLIWVLVPEGTDLRARLGQFGGYATLVRASPETKSNLGVFHPEPGPLAAIATGLRDKFDPNHILNPGLMG
ncbi:MAG: FAD-binding protein [Pseudomonadota bacterium]